MTRYLFVIPLVLPLVLMASAAPAQQGQDACARDVSRFCRAQMNSGDMVVLSCLQQHRARISKACQQVLASHGR
jgi:cysteine rich repeat protein